MTGSAKPHRPCSQASWVSLRSTHPTLSYPSIAALSTPRPYLAAGLNQAPGLRLDPAQQRGERLRTTVRDFRTVVERVGPDRTIRKPAAGLGMSRPHLARERGRGDGHCGK